ncbi:MAG: isochorismatase family cysteine hydrolase [Jatrophihabitantaceae bacterium]
MQLRAGATLAVIDMQNVFADPASDWCTPGFAELLQPIAELVAAFGARTVFTRFIAPQRPIGAWQPYYRQWPFALTPPDSAQYQLVDAFQQPGRTTISSTTFGKWTPELAAAVGDPATGAELVLVGVSTDCCVLSTALAAADAGIRVIVAGDGCAGVDEASHQRALAAMAMYAPLIEVGTVAEVLAARRVAGG